MPSGVAIWDDRLGHVDIGLRRRRIAGWVLCTSKLKGNSYSRTMSCVNVENNWGMVRGRLNMLNRDEPSQACRSLCRQSTVPSNHGFRIDINPRGSKVHGTHARELGRRSGKGFDPKITAYLTPIFAKTFAETGCGC